MLRGSVWRRVLSNTTRSLPVKAGRAGHNAFSGEPLSVRHLVSYYPALARHSAQLLAGTACRRGHAAGHTHRMFTISRVRHTDPDHPQTEPQTARITFQFSDGRSRTVDAKLGSNLLDVVLDHDIDIDGFGACEGTLACSTCHLVLPPALFERIDEPASAEELDMLDLAYDLRDTSRLGCQCVVTRHFDGETIIVPTSTNDLRTN